MLNIAIILLENSYCSSVAGIIDVFQVANAHCRRSPDFSQEPFSWSLLSERANEQVSILGGIRLVSDAPLRTAEKFDLVCLPGVFYTGAKVFNHWLEQQTALYKLLRNLSEKNVKLAANCTSTFLLAEAGLLTNKTATTTWWLEQQFRSRYPDVNLEANNTLTEDSGIYCAGALTAYHQLALRLVEEYASAEIATLAAKTMLINRGEISQAPYHNLNIPNTSENAADDPLIDRAQYWLRNHIRNDVDFATLAQELGTSQRTLIRRFKQAANTTPLKYLQNLRIESATRLLAKSPLSVADIMTEVGYSDPSAFNRLFKDRMELTPSAYRQRFAES